MAFFKIGDRVRIYATNLTGSVTDVLRSDTGSEIRYLVDLDGSDAYASNNMVYRERELEPFQEKRNDYKFEIEISDNVVVAVAYEDGRAIARGHVHIMHDNLLGISQAASYAMRKLYEALGGTFKNKNKEPGETCFDGRRSDSVSGRFPERSSGN